MGPISSDQSSRVESGVWFGFISLILLSLTANSNLMVLTTKASTLLTLDTSFLRDNIAVLSEIFPESTPKILLYLAVAVIDDSALRRNLQQRLDELKDEPIFKSSNKFDG